MQIRSCDKHMHSPRYRLHNYLNKRVDVANETDDRDVIAISDEV